ncbi:lipopolysaccharide kinase InaA family protein [Halorhodospira halochloris]|nr:lipopolysaccharide kinase InaA family protein [Halorhodospira halochloris]
MHIEIARRLLLEGTVPQDAELITDRKSTVYRIEIERSAYYVKHYCATDTKERIKRMLRSPRRNIDLWERLKAIGILSPEPLLVAKQGKRFVLITPEVRLPSIRQHSAKQGTLGVVAMHALGRTWGILHTNGLMHVDPSPSNILLTNGQSEQPMGLLDLDSLYYVGLIPNWLARQRLSQLFSRFSADSLKQCGALPPPTGFQAFWQGYQTVTKQPAFQHAIAVINRLEKSTAYKRARSHREQLLAATAEWRRHICSHGISNSSSHN